MFGLFKKKPQLSDEAREFISKLAGSPPVRVDR
jgi:hypothetical protein